jgi:uncharacterized membrane protein YraQ (UPF0718 family)
MGADHNNYVSGFERFNDLFLRMSWLEQLVGYFFETIIGLPPDSILHGILTFFVYDVIKIVFLLVVLIFLVSYIQSFFTPEKTRKILKPLKGIKGNVAGALLGTLTPFCSCSSIPIFIGFTKAGLPIGITFSFLISSPLVDLASVVLLASIFGWQIAMIYVVVGLVIAIVGGTLIEAFKMDRYLASFLQRPSITVALDMPSETQSQKDRIHYAWQQVKEILVRVFPYILIGVSIGALIHNVIPQTWIEVVLGADKWYAVPLATLIGVPIYADIFGTLPIAESLVTKGVGIGTILSFMMAVTALSLPSMIMLKKVVKTPLLSFFIGYLVISIMAMGFLFNVIGSFL